MALRQAVKLGGGVPVRFAVLMHDLGKAATPPTSCPRIMATKTRAWRWSSSWRRLRVPNHLRELAVITARYHTHVHRAFELRAATVLQTLESCDALRRPERFADFLLACEADVRGRTGLEDRSYPQREYLRGGARRRGRRGADRRRAHRTFGRADR